MMTIRNFLGFIPYKEIYLQTIIKRWQGGIASAAVKESKCKYKKNPHSKRLKKQGSETNLKNKTKHLDAQSLLTNESYNFDGMLGSEDMKEDVVVNNEEILANVKEWTDLSKRTTKSLMSKKGRQISFLLKKQERCKIFSDTFAAYICVCMTTGMEDLAFRKFFSVLKNKENDLYVKTMFSIKVFNELLKGIASKGDFTKMKELSILLNKIGVDPDVNTFSLILTCLGRCGATEYEIRHTLEWMQKKNISLEDLFVSAIFPGDSLEICIDTIEKVLPNVRETLQKCKEKQYERLTYDNSLVNSLNDSIFTFKSNSPADGVLTTEELLKMTNEQINWELKGFVEIPNILRDINGSEESNENQGRFEKWQKDCRESLLKIIAARKGLMKDVGEQSSTQRNFGINTIPFFYSIDDEDIVDLLLLEMNTLCHSMDSKVTFNTLSLSLGKKVYQRFVIKYQRLNNDLESLRKTYEKYCEWYMKNSDKDLSNVHRVQWNKLLLDGSASNILRDLPPEWPGKVQLDMGRLLSGILLTAVISWKSKDGSQQTNPAFQKIYRFMEDRVYEQMLPSPFLVEIFQGDTTRALTFPANLLPMMSVPLPWTSIDSGGYIFSRSDFVRSIDVGNVIQRRLQAEDNQKLYPVFDSLNQLGSIPWKIDHSQLDLIIQIFRNNGWAKMDISPPTSVLEKPSTQPTWNEKTNGERRELNMQYAKQKREMHSLWCDMLYKLSIANFYRDCVIWLPQTVDFRGRVYPVPPHLTHLSSDIHRSFFKFAQGKKLGKDGLFWLKLHLVNLTGAKKKCGIQERMDYCEEVLHEIFDSADNPLDGNQWWTQSDEPWQTLAACKELVRALRSGDPESFVSHLPIHQDGSCNGLQHYAALSKDKAGAELVNLSPSLVPQDVYSTVAARVEEARKKDADAGLQLAKSLEGIVKRKIVKQTVMTTVYGVTHFGARLQILKQLNYLDELKHIDRKKAAAYLTQKTFQSLGTIFTSTQEIQSWLGQIARAVSFNCLQNVEWVTPLGLPIVQPYSKSRLPAYECMNDYFLIPDTRKQKNSFPPNFIHSLDSSHMMLTSLFCQDAGITFVSVHDCFWTHASTVPIMNKICREQFLALHSQPILENMTKTMSEKYSNHVRFNYADKRKIGEKSLEDLLSTVPKKGTFDTSELLNSVFFFS